MTATSTGAAVATRTYLCFDYGAKRIGVAVGQDLTRTANALATVAVREGRPDWDTLAKLVAEWRPDGFVLGIPSTADGRPHAMQPAIERFARRLTGRFGRRVAFVDERLSSYAAGTDPQTRNRGIDAVAARYILESWLSADEIE